MQPMADWAVPLHLSFGVVIDFQVSRWLDWIVNNASTPV
jgi:hypothetical protein